MFDYDDLQQLLAKAKSDIHDLKQAKRAGLILKTYTYQDDDFTFGTGIYRINYADGDQPIITSTYNDIAVTMFTPEANEQYFSVLAVGIGFLILVSTREVLSVERIS